ncbi:hypothetical protein [Halorhabdus rudnickae]|uniref:hypothetical protein n=1 Tax=Halorhabdus rudnickae TaxID=1775544 RepID=UPI001084140B|nr:hypothetical protein [Halorhabdus rudnickae]
MIDPADLAETLPDRPLRSSEVDDIADKFNWSVMTAPYQSDVADEGDTEQTLVPMWFVFQPTDTPSEDDINEIVGDAICMRLEQEDGWIGEVIEADVTQSAWIKVNEAYSQAIGCDIEIQEIVSQTDSGEVARSFASEATQ